MCRWRLAKTPEEAAKAAKDLSACLSRLPLTCLTAVLRADTKEFVVKSQIHAGGRGKGTFDNGYKGGVQVVKTYALAEMRGRRWAQLTARSVEEVKKCAENMLGHRLKTAQTAPEGVLVNKVRSMHHSLLPPRLIAAHSS